MTRKKKIAIVFLALTIILAILLLIVALLGVGVKAGKDGIIVDAPFYNLMVATDDIRTIEIYENMNYGEKTGGSGFLGVNTGKYTNIEFGTYIACLHKSNKTCIAVLKSDGFYTVFNLENEEKTVKLYNELLDLYGLN
jgi:hypothetical protein